MKLKVKNVTQRKIEVHHAILYVGRITEVENNEEIKALLKSGAITETK